MDMKLRVVDGKNSGQEIPVNGKRFLIGRAEDCHLRPGSELISRHHCAILVEEGYIGVRDFGSKNGTFVNDERVVGERELKAGDRLSVGHLHFEIHVAHGLGAKKKPPVGDVKEAVSRTATNAAKDPLDVAQWLSGEASVDTTATADTKDASFTDTDSINISATQSVTHETPDEESEHDDDKGHKGKKQPGKLPPIPNSSKDSQDAAAAVLSRMRKRR